MSATSALAQATETSDSGAYVRVSRDEVRVYFPPETSSGWGRGSLRPEDRIGLLMWSALPEGGRGAAKLALRFRFDSGSSTIPSLETIAREGRSNFCLMDMVSGRCSSAGVNPSVENRRIVLSYRDTAEIRQLFGLRPATVLLLRHVPEALGGGSFSDAPVHYADPPIVVDSAQRAAIVAERRRREASVNTRSRYLAGGSHRGPLWLAIGDSAWLYVQDNECLIDVCGSSDYFDALPRNWGRWSLSDSSRVTLHHVTLKEPYERPSDDHGRAIVLVAVRPGRVTVRATGVHTPADTMPSLTPVDTILERKVIVTQPVSRLMISPRPTSMIVGAPMTFTVRALDRSGREIEGIPVELRWETNLRSVTSSSGSETVTFTQPGRHGVDVSLGAYTDSVMVDVRFPPTRP